MQLMRKPATEGQRHLSSLRSRLRRPEPYLVGVLVVLLMLGGDLLRAPAHQVSASAYRTAVDGYQRWARPLLKGHIVCRFHPSCSVYSREAVTRWGTLEGLRLTYRRLNSCRTDIPLATSDPVPAEAP